MDSPIHDPFTVTISMPTGRPDNTATFTVCADHITLGAAYNRDAIELCRAVLLDLADALAVRMAQDRH